MKKFSKLNESLNKEILGWSPNDILEYLKKIPNCKANYKSTYFVFRDGDSHEICTLENIKDGVIKSTYLDDFILDSEQEYHVDYTFSLEFGNSNGIENYLLFDKGLEKEVEDGIPLSKITKIFTDIENSVNPLYQLLENRSKESKNIAGVYFIRPSKSLSVKLRGDDKKQMTILASLCPHMANKGSGFSWISSQPKDEEFENIADIINEMGFIIEFISDRYSDDDIYTFKLVEF